MSKRRPISRRKPFPAPVLEWMELHFTQGQQSRLKMLALAFMSLNSEEHKAVKMLENAFDTSYRGEVKENDEIGESNEIGPQ